MLVGKRGQFICTPDYNLRWVLQGSLEKLDLQFNRTG